MKRPVQALVAGAVLVSALSGCALLGAGSTGDKLTVYLLETAPALEPVEQRGCHTVVVTPPEPAPGFSTAQMLYRRSANELERFAYSRWAESPAAMLEPLLVQALRAREAFGAVLGSPAPVKADLRVESEGLKLIQVFDGGPSRVLLQLEVRVYSPADRRLLASELLSYDLPAAQANAQAGVAAADAAVARMLTEFSELVVRAAAESGVGCREGTDQSG